MYLMEFTLPARRKLHVMRKKIVNKKRKITLALVDAKNLDEIIVLIEK